MSKEDSIDDLYARLCEFREKRDWRKFHSPKDLAVSVSVESAELLELFQWKTDIDVQAHLSDSAFMASLASEISDVFIYLILLSKDLGIDLVQATSKKIDTNETRFPVLTE